ncbi:Ig-like domain-containing protein [Reichenbachiella agarivorans]|uniref:Ig-like domain-containing protein n=1 Tax=Reichenbachiella agarivorans TaxID=2979464 RepID=A0ABY6CRJ9_9BACT|nr:Ig-like domain-containing protein [Reichenbachiella agarivorans]UXP31993.1 Ig-like domain-containing protein [Reichenbachiella agarivorans]
MREKLRFCIVSVLLCLSGVIACQITYAQTHVKVDIATLNYLGESNELKREKYFAYHNTGSDTEMQEFETTYDVVQGRRFWSPYGYAKNQTGEVAKYPAFKPDNDNSVRSVKRQIATEHPSNAFLDGMDPVSAGEWAAEYYKNWVEDDERPMYFEPMNEPFVHASEFYDGGWNIAENIRIKKQMSQLYGQIGKAIHATPELVNMKVIGYSAAWPSMELDNFSHWGENMKSFMDIAGEHMDAFSTHLYDGINVEGQNNKRSGSNSEAILDLIECYSFAKWGVVKPHAISEYGGIENGYGTDYSDLASVQTVRSINHLLFNLLNRDDRVEVSIPFITGKATWHISAENNYQPYGAVLWKPTNIGEPTPAGWEYTPRITFFQLWKDVKGKRVDITSDNFDIQTVAYLDGNKLYVGLNNLSDNTQEVNLEFLNGLPEVAQISHRSIKIYSDQAHEYKDEMLDELPAAISMVEGQTSVLIVELSQSVDQFEKTVTTRRYYSSRVVEGISANAPILYQFKDVEVGQGRAQLNFGIGRKHDRTKQPEVLINGVKVEVPDNWKGYDQADREDFFGLIEVPFSADLLVTGRNIVSLTFPDGGGQVSSVVLQSTLDNASLASDEISLNPAEMNMDIGDEVQMEVSMDGTSDITWASSNQLVATVTADGVVTALAEGRCMISAKTADGLIAYSTVYVVDEVLSVDGGLNNSEWVLYPNPANGGDVSIRFNQGVQVQKLEVLNLTGQLLYARSINAQRDTLEIPLSQFTQSEALLLVRVRTEKGVLLTKVVSK